jgi:anti-sigma factor RsiW
MKLTCKEASRLISAGLDRRLSVADRTQLRFHLALCDACNKLKAQFEFIRTAVATYTKSKDDDQG